MGQDESKHAVEQRVKQQGIAPISQELKNKLARGINLNSMSLNHQCTAILIDACLPLIVRACIQSLLAPPPTTTVKVLIKGDRNTGKTCLWNMLQRKRFVHDYIATPEIQVATIDWSFKCMRERVRVRESERVRAHSMRLTLATTARLC
jgi:hypothetical protein